MEVGRFTEYVKGQGESCLDLLKHVSCIKKELSAIALANNLGS